MKTTNTHYAVMGDLHLRFNQVPVNRQDSFARDIREKLQWVIDECKRRDTKYLILTGDLRDIKNITSWQEVINIISAFKMFDTAGIKVLTIKGNHDADICNYPIYQMLADLNLIHPLDNNPFILDKQEKIKVFGIDFTPDLKELQEKIMTLNSKVDKSDKNILVIHEHLIPKLEGFFTKANLNYLLYKDISILANNFKQVIGGHYHKPYPPTELNRVQIINPSSLVRIAINEKWIPNIYFSNTDEQIDIAVAKPHLEIFIKSSVLPTDDKKVDMTDLIDALKSNDNTNEKQEILTNLFNNMSKSAQATYERLEQEIFN